MDKSAAPTSSTDARQRAGAFQTLALVRSLAPARSQAKNKPGREKYSPAT
jgi:hypothetical protein